MHRGLEYMQKLESHILNTELKEYAEIERAKGTHCINIRFDSRAPIHFIEQIKLDIEKGIYPGIKLVPIFQRKNLYDLHVCLDACDNPICNMIDIEEETDPNLFSSLPRED